MALGVQQVYDKYFRNKPAADDLEKASYAYHFTRHSQPDAHSFITSHRDHAPSEESYFKAQTCEWCNKSRSEIRWSDTSATCAFRPAPLDTGAVLLKEEESYFRLLERSGPEIRKAFRRKFVDLDAPALVYFHSTLGYDPDTVSAALDLDVETLMPEYSRLKALADKRLADPLETT